MADEKKYSVLNTLTDEFVFSGTLEECKQQVITDKTGFLQLCESFS